MAKHCFYHSQGDSVFCFRFLTLRQLLALSFWSQQHSGMGERVFCDQDIFIDTQKLGMIHQIDDFLWVPGDWRNNQFYDSHETLTCLTGFCSARYQKSLEKKGRQKYENFINLVFRAVSLHVIANTISSQRCCLHIYLAENISNANSHSFLFWGVLETRLWQWVKNSLWPTAAPAFGLRYWWVGIGKT